MLSFQMTFPRLSLRPIAPGPVAAVATVAVLAALYGSACTTNPSPPAGKAATPASATSAPPAASSAATPPPSRPAETAAAAATTATGGRHVETPPDGVWLKDENGREYYLDKYSKKQRYDRLGENRVRTVWGIDADVAKEDDEALYLKIYRITSEDASPVHGAAPGADALAAAAKNYVVDAPKSDRLHATLWGSGLPTRGQWREGFSVADMNGDRFLDIVYGPARKGAQLPHIFLGDGKGNFHPWSDASFPSASYDYGDAAAADFDGDGKMDIALAMHLKGLLVLLGDRRGNFRIWSQGLDRAGAPGDAGRGFSSRAIAAVDWNADGKADLLALGEGPRLGMQRLAPGEIPHGSSGRVIYLNKGTSHGDLNKGTRQGEGDWARYDRGTGANEIMGDCIVVGDFNGDHKPDFATSSGMLGRADLVNLNDGRGGWTPVELAVRPQAYITAVAAADFDHDGRDDLAVAYLSTELGVYRTGIDVFYSRADGPWQRRALVVQEGRVSFSALGAGHLVGRKEFDLVAFNNEGVGTIFPGDGKGFLTIESRTIEEAGDKGCGGSHVELRDLDGDGKGEIVASFAGEAESLARAGGCPSGGSIRIWKVQAK